MGVPGGADRRPAVLHHHDAGRGPGPLVGPVRDLAGRTRHLGRDRVRHARRPVGAATPQGGHPEIPGRRRAGAARRAGDRPDRQLLQPGAVRWPDDAAVGTEDRSRAPARRVRPIRDVPPNVSLRDHLEPVARRVPRVAGANAQDPSAGAVRAVRRRLLGLSHLRGDAADRHVEPRARPAAQLLRRDRSVHRRAGVVRRHATWVALPTHGRLARPRLDRRVGRRLRLSGAGRSPRAWQHRSRPSAADRR